ncbi:MAG: T9SS type A sorting domain-containing protein, partial [Bacteroidetes bacterium]|nr:T9SS type A sorting domain-containing protein [Bacteroidota bacterium]
VVLVHDNGNSPVPGATVSVSFTGPNTGTSSGVTGANGVVILQTPTIRNPVGIWCFTVTDVQLSGYTFQTGHAEGVTCEASTPKSTGTSPVAMELESVFPNPADADATITFTVPDEGTVRLTLHDLLGRERRVLTDGYTTRGKHVVAFRVADLPSGLYYCRLLHGGQARIHRLLISR